MQVRHATDPVSCETVQIAVELAQESPGGQQVAALMSSGYERIHQMMAQVRHAHCFEGSNSTSQKW